MSVRTTKMLPRSKSFAEIDRGWLRVDCAALALSEACHQSSRTRNVRTGRTELGVWQDSVSVENDIRNSFCKGHVTLSKNFDPNFSPARSGGKSNSAIVGRYLVTTYLPPSIKGHSVILERAIGPERADFQQLARGLLLTLLYNGLHCLT